MIVVWNKEAEHMLFDRNPRGYAVMSNAKPEAIFKPCPYPPIHSMLDFSKYQEDPA